LPVKIEMGLPNLSNATAGKTFLELPSVLFVKEVERPRAPVIILIRERDNYISTLDRWPHSEGSERPIGIELLNDECLKHHFA
jgi:hypothetical protein